MKRLVLAFLLFVFALSGYSKDNPYFSGQISLLNGDIITGLVKVPKAPSDRQVVYKINEEGNKETVDVEQIRTITLNSKSGEKYVFDCLKLDLRPKKDKIKITKKTAILYRLSVGYANLYVASNVYSVNEDGNIEVIHKYYQGTDIPTFYYYIKRENEKVATYFCYSIPGAPVIGLQKVLVHRCGIVFDDAPQIIERVKNEEFNHLMIQEFIDAYNENR